ncbi:hypothetical protein CPB83DRAFT_899834 [Crepidotus variabilis]|uniref:Uncharacterized protein n=1 Tax=Crepidotus variabilis TaxID=179855 RepID=A0A9P6JIM3_9AGAR|nr:hypothetical protein CPB83DRAFT_899834 [Crepidotus variabilis]
MNIISYMLHGQKPHPKNQMPKHLNPRTQDRGGSRDVTGGQIQVKLSSGGNLGYLSNGLISKFYTLTSTLTNAGTFTFSGNLLHRSTATTTSPYVGALIQTSRDDFVSNSINSVLGDAGATATGAKSQPNNDPSSSHYGIESAIWSHNLASGGVTAQLVKDNGTTPSASILMFGSFLYLTPDLAAVLKNFPTVKVVTFTLL